MAMPTALAQREQTQALEAFRANVRTDVLAAIAEHKAALHDSALSADDYNKIRRLHDDKVARHKRTRTLTRTRTFARTRRRTHSWTNLRIVCPSAQVSRARVQASRKPKITSPPDSSSSRGLVVARTPGLVVARTRRPVVARSRRVVVGAAALA